MDTELLTTMRTILMRVPDSKLDTFADAYSTLLEDLGLTELVDDFHAVYIAEYTRRKEL